MSRSSLLVVLSLVGVLVACGHTDGSPALGSSPTTARASSTVPDSTRAGGTSPSTAPPDATPDSSVPDAYALREPYPSCGEDFSLALDSVGPPSTIRQCFFDANASAKPAELISHEIGTAPDAPTFFVYRTNPDRTVDVFIPALGRTEGQPWRTFHCAGLAPDSRRAFDLAGCTDPVDVE